MTEHKANLVIDAAHSVLGRVASYAAKQALLGKTVAIVNCNQTVITGKVRTTINEYNTTRRRGGSSLNGPFFPKHPDRIMKRTVRGMLSYTQQRGLDAFKRIRAYNEVPKEYADVKKITLLKNITAKTISLQELSKEI